MSQIKFIVNAIKWHDGVNGNTYHSVRITRCKDSKVIRGELQYGYDDAYRQTARELMFNNGWMPKKYKNQECLYERENDYPIHWNVTDGTKRECRDNGIEGCIRHKERK